MSQNGLITDRIILRKIAHIDAEDKLPGTVVRLNDFRNRDVILFCEQLLEKAVSGEITGLIYTARLNGEDHAVSAVGVYSKDSQVALPAMAQMAEALAAHVAKNS